MSEPETALPRHCPECGRPFEDGYGRLRSEVRGFWPNSSRPIGIYQQPDRDLILCRRCFEIYDRVLSAVAEGSFHWLNEGYNRATETRS